MSALSDLENLQLRDISDGDVRDDPRWQALMGEAGVKAFLAEMAAKHLGDETKRHYVRDDEGQFAETPGGGGVDVIPGDKLKLAGRIPLGDGESLVASNVFEPHGGGLVPLALTRGPGGARLRIGTGIDSDDKKRWAGRNLGQTANLDENSIRQLRSVLDEMRDGGDEGGKRFRALEERADELDQQRRDIFARQYRNLSKSDAKQLDRINRRIENLDNEIEHRESGLRDTARFLAENDPEGKRRWDEIFAEIATLNPDDDADARRIQRLQDEAGRIPPSPRTSNTLNVLPRMREERDGWEAERQELTANPTPLSDRDHADLAAVDAEIAANKAALAQMEESTLVDGVIPGEWADLVYEVSTHETTYEYDDFGVEYRIGARPRDADDDWGLTEEYGVTELDPTELAKLAAMLDKLTGGQPKSAKRYDPHQLRDPGGEDGGQWVAAPGGDGGKNPLDKLNLGKRIDLKPGEKLLSSRRIRPHRDTESWDLMAAEVDTPSGRQVRLGIIHPDDSKHWTAGPDLKRSERIAELDAEIERLDGLVLDDDGSDRLDDLQTERSDLIEFDRGNLNRTAAIAPPDAARMRTDLEAGIEKAKVFSKATRKLAGEYDAIDGDASLTPQQREARLAEIQSRINAIGDDDQYFVTGSIPGGPEGDLHYRVEGTGDGEFAITMGIKPPTWDRGYEWGIGVEDDVARFEGADTRKLLGALQELESGDQPKSAHRPDTQGKHLPGRHDQSSHGRGRQPKVPGLASDASPPKPKPPQIEDTPPAPRPRRTSRPKPEAVEELPKPTVPEPTKPPARRREPKPKPPRTVEPPPGPPIDEQIDAVILQIADLQDRAEEPLRFINEIDKKRERGKGSGTEEIDAYERARRTMERLTVEGQVLANRHLDLLSERDGGPWGGSADNMPTAKPFTAPVPGASAQQVSEARDEYVIKDTRTIANNASLRSGRPTPAARAWRKRMAAMVESEKIGNDSVVYRGGAFTPEMVMRLRPGAILEDPAIVSTDESRDRAMFYADHRAMRNPGSILTTFIIKAPTGTNGFAADYGEFVFADSPLRVLKVERSGNAVEVSAEMLPASDRRRKFAKDAATGAASSIAQRDTDSVAAERFVWEDGDLSVSPDGGEPTSPDSTKTRSAMNTKMDVKSFNPTIKAVGESGEGTATFRIASYNEVDKDGDVTVPGFFGKQHVTMVPVHDWNHVPIGKGLVYEQSDGVYCDVKFNLAIPEAKAWYEAIKFDMANPPALQQYSYGYEVLPGGSKSGQHSGRQVRYLTPMPDGNPGVKVFEVSPVLQGAGTGTRTVSVKGRSMRINRAGTETTTTGTRAVKGAIPSHETKTVSRAWDRTRTENALPNDGRPSELRTVYAWVDPDGDPELKASYSHPHHHGIGGPANLRACLMGIATLNGSAGEKLGDAERKGIYDHLAAHFKDGDREPPALRDRGAGPAKQYDELSEGLAIISGLIDGAYSGAALRREKGRGLSGAKAELLHWMADDLTRLKSLLSNPVEPETPEPDDDEIASVFAASIARLNGITPA